MSTVLWWKVVPTASKENREVRGDLTLMRRNIKAKCQNVSLTVSMHRSANLEISETEVPRASPLKLDVHPFISCAREKKRGERERKSRGRREGDGKQTGQGRVTPTCMVFFLITF